MPKFYSDQLGAPLGMIALAIALARAFDAITDPAMGWLSDRFPTRWGRRRPWIALGVPLTSLSILALFGPPPSLSPTGASIWFGLSFAAYFLFHTVYYVPYGALGFELTPDYNERSSLFGWAQAASLVGTSLAAATPWVAGSVFAANPSTGYLVVGGTFAVLLVVLFGWMVVQLRERPEFVTRESNPIVPGVRRTLRNAPFRLLLTVYVIASLTGAIPATLAPFYIPYVLKPDDEFLILSLTIGLYVGVGALSIPVWVFLARHFGKRTTWLLSIVIGIVGGLTLFFMGEGDTVPFLTAIVFVGSALGAGLLHPAMQADIIDYDELRTGKRREAQYASFWAMIPKFVVIPSAAIPLAVLAAAGYIPKNPEQPEAVVFALRALLGLAPALTGVIAFVVALRFPMTEERHRKVVEGIALHEQGLPAEDPLTGEILPPPGGSAVPEATGWFLDHMSRSEIRAALAGRAAEIPRRVGLYALANFALCVGLATWVVTQLGDINQKPGTLVTLAVVAGGFALAGFAFHALRLGAALRLRDDPPDTAILKAHLESH